MLRQRGLSLFDLDLYRYTRSALPGHFLYSFPSQTREGQVVVGDALYLRDVCARGYDERWGGPLPVSKLAKLACLCEIFGLPDCAAELLQQRRELNQMTDSSRYLDELARQFHPGVGSIGALRRKFEADREPFYPQTMRERARRSLPRPVRRVLSTLKRRVLRS